MDSEKAHCLRELDKILIHAAIKSLWSDGFNNDHINASVEKIRLQHLLDYPVRRITGHDGVKKYENSEYETKER